MARILNQAAGKIVKKYNVIPDYWNSQLREYVIPTVGSVLFTVYDKTGQKVAAGVQVSGLPGVGATETFTTDDNGQFKDGVTSGPASTGPTPTQASQPFTQYKQEDYENPKFIH